MQKNKVSKKGEQRRNEILKSGHYVRVEIIVPAIKQSGEQTEPHIVVETSKSNIIMKLTMYDMLKQMTQIYLEEHPEIKLAQHFYETETINKGSSSYEEKTETEMDKFVDEAIKKLLEIVEKEEKEKKDKETESNEHKEKVKQYEAIMIIDPTQSEETLETLTNKFVAQLNAEGTVVKAEKLGKKKLAFPIKEYEEGHYVMITFCGEQKLADELEKQWRDTEEIIKSLIVIK